MPVFFAQSKSGGIMMSDYTRKLFNDFLKKNEGIRLKIESITPESTNQRRYFEGCLIPLITYFQEHLDHRNNEDCKKVREWLMQEFLSETAIVNNTPRKVVKTSKGQLKSLIEKTIDWLNENYAIPQEAINPDDYKKWRDTLYSFGEHETYIEYLQSKHILKKEENKPIWRQ